MNEDKVKSDLFKPTGIEYDVKLKYLDIPKVIDFNEQIHTEFFAELSQSEDYELFSNKAIRKIIDFMHPTVIKYTALILFLPYAIFVIMYEIYTIELYSKIREYEDTNKHYEAAHKSFLVILTVFSFYFIIFEMI